MNNEKLQGSSFVKVSGILMIIGGAIVAIIGALALAGTMAYAELAAFAGVLGMLISASAVAIVGGAIQLVVGILGVKHSRNPEKADLLMKAGIVVAALSILSLVLNLMAGGTFNIISVLTGLLIPGLFIYGAMQNKKTME